MNYITYYDEFNIYNERIVKEDVYIFLEEVMANNSGIKEEELLEKAVEKFLCDFSENEIKEMTSKTFIEISK